MNHRALLRCSFTNFVKRKGTLPRVKNDLIRDCLSFNKPGPCFSSQHQLRNVFCFFFVVVVVLSFSFSCFFII